MRSPACIDTLACDPPAFRRCKECGDIRDIRRLSPSSEDRIIGAEFTGGIILQHCGIHVRGNESGLNGVDRNSAGAQLRSYSPIPPRNTPSSSRSGGRYTKSCSGPGARAGNGRGKPAMSGLSRATLSCIARIPIRTTGKLKFISLCANSRLERKDRDG